MPLVGVHSREILDRLDSKLVCKTAPSWAKCPPFAALSWFPDPVPGNHVPARCDPTYPEKHCCCQYWGKWCSFTAPGTQ